MTHDKDPAHDPAPTFNELATGATRDEGADVFSEQPTWFGDRHGRHQRHSKLYAGGLWNRLRAWLRGGDPARRATP